MRPRLLPWQYSGMSPTQRTLAWFGDRGYVVAVVERWIPGARQRRDCFGCDLLAAHPDRGIVLVQVCAADVAAHVTKLKTNSNARTFVEAGGEVMCVGWRALKGTGWTPRIWRMSTGVELGLETTMEGFEWQPPLVRNPDRVPDHELRNDLEASP